MAGSQCFSVFFVCALFATLSAFERGDPTNCHIDDYDSVESVIQNCNNIVVNNVSVPAGKTLKLDLKSGTNLTFNGIITFDYQSWNGPLVSITGEHLIVDGSGNDLLQGRGDLWWDGLGENSPVQKPLLVYIQANLSTFRYISIKDCPGQCVKIADSYKLKIQNWDIDISDGDKKGATNTDGFVLYNTDTLIMQGCSITNQNDCICVYSGEHISIQNVECYEGQGLTLAAGQATEYSANTIYNLTFQDSYLTRTKSGIHIKTTPGDYKGEISNVTYQNIKLKGVTEFGIKVQQDFLSGESTGKPQGNILIKDLVINGVHGTMKGPDSVEAYILCGDDGCQNWKWDGVDFTGAEKPNSCNFNPGGFEC